MCVLYVTMTEAQNFDAGFIGGFTTSQVSGDNLAGYNKLGARTGVYISFPIHKKMKSQVEIQYLQKGSKKPFIENSPETYVLDLHYIELPISLNYEVKKNLHLESGLGTAFLIHSKEQDEIGDINSVEPNTIAIDFLLGIQYQLKKHLKFNLRYANSIIPLRKHSSNGNWGVNKGQYSSLISFAFMYQISQ